MTGKHSANPRTVAIILVACLLLLGLVLATNKGLSSSAPPAAPPPPPPTSSVPLRGSVQVQVRHLSAHTWEFRYVVRNTGTSPIGGFQLNGSSANLYAVSAHPSWPVFGSGICRGHYPGVLAYWSTGGGSGPIEPGKAGRFSFKVNTSGSSRLKYSLSFGASAPLFGTIAGPSPSKLPVTGSCH